MNNTYIQDTKIPIYIFLEYQNTLGHPNLIKFPINPDSLEKGRASSSSKTKIEGLGEVSVPEYPNLATISIKSFFWQDKNLLPSNMYVSWLEKWQESKLPAKLIVTRLNYSMNVTCEGFRHWINAGEEKDIYFELNMQEYRPYGVGIGKMYEPDYVTRLLNLQSSATLPILIDIPRPSRSSVNTPVYYNPYITGKNETLLSISKKITGSDEKWKELYEENKKTIADSNIEIKSGTSLNLPSSWISSYNVKDRS